MSVMGTIAPANNVTAKARLSFPGSIANLRKKPPLQLPPLLNGINEI